jgi:hypothetical protein
MKKLLERSIYLVLALSLSIAVFPPLMSLAQIMPPGMVLPAPNIIGGTIDGVSTSGVPSNVNQACVTTDATHCTWQTVGTASGVPASFSTITGQPTDSANLATALNAKAPLASPTFTGTVGGITAAMVGAPSGSGTSTGSNTGDQTITLTGGVTGSGTGSFAATVVTNANLTGDVTSSGNAATVVKLNGTSLAGLGTGLVKNTTGTGVPSIAVNSDLPAMSATVGGAVPTPPNNTTTFLRGDGTFNTPAGTYSLPTATSSVLGGVKPDGTTITNSSGAISVTYGTTSGTAAQGGVITAAGPTGSATVAPIITYNAAGQLTTVTSATITPAVGSVTGLGTGVATALGVNVGTAGAPVVFNGAGGTPSSLTGTNISGTASGLTVGNATAAVTATNQSGGTVSATTLTATGYPTFGATGTNGAQTITGSNSGSGNGASLEIINGTTGLVYFGNYSSAVGGAYSANGAIYSLNSFILHAAGVESTFSSTGLAVTAISATSKMYPDTGDTPTIASGACGTTTNGTISGNDQTGVITIASAATTTCTISFGATWTTAPKACLFSPGNAAAAAATTLPYSTITNTTTWVLHGAVLASTTWNYHCF